MQSKKIKQILKQFEENDTYSKIFINGPWGIGKSYYINEYIEKDSNKIVYISLFGKNSYEALEDTFALELIYKLNDIQKAKKKLVKFMKKIMASISYSFKGVSITPSVSIEKKSFFKQYSKLLKKKKIIIVIDDLERKSNNIPIEDIMGIIEQFSLYPNIKILIVGSEENMNAEDKKKWLSFKEKLIEKEYKITSFSEDAIQSLVINKVKFYIGKEESELFIKSFLEKHKINNLRTIEKGINLFLEIVENYLKNQYQQTTYLSILKNCMAVTIEYTEELYKPQEEQKANENEKQNSFKERLQKSIDEDIYSRIISHYFHNILVRGKESSILEYIIKIFFGEIDESIINDFNNVVKNYLDIKEEKNLFYLSETEIARILKKRYEDIQTGKYNYSTKEKVMDDFYELISWNKALNLDFNISIISEKFKQILFNNYYSIEKEEYQNMIDIYDLKKYSLLEINDLVSKYNKECEKRYSTEKLERIILEYTTKNYNIERLQWLNWSLLQQNKEKIIKHVMSKFKEKNYLIPDLSGEITEKEWQWTHSIWEIYAERFPSDSKKIINEYAEQLKVNKLSKSRIEALQNSRPLINLGAELKSK